MTKENAIKLFKIKEFEFIGIRMLKKWYFSIVDVIEILTESPRPRKYWNALKTKLNKEGSQLSQKLGTFEK